MDKKQTVCGADQAFVIEARTAVARAATALCAGEGATANLHLFAAMQALGSVQAGGGGIRDTAALTQLRSRLAAVRMSNRANVDSQLRFLLRVREALDALQ